MLKRATDIVRASGLYSWSPNPKRIQQSELAYCSFLFFHIERCWRLLYFRKDVVLLRNDIYLPVVKCTGFAEVSISNGGFLT